MPQLTLETYEQALERVIREGLAEDVGAGDVTTLATVPAEARATGELRLKAPGVLAGLDAFAAVFAALDPGVRVEPLAADGDAFDDVPRDVALVDGPARALLSGERLALNLLQRLSGIATRDAPLRGRGRRHRRRHPRHPQDHARACALLDKHAVRVPAAAPTTGWA